MVSRGNRKRSMLKALRPIKFGRYGNGYSVMKHMTWLWQLPYSKQLREVSLMINKLLFLGYKLTPEELAIIARVMRKGNDMFFAWFESGEYVPTERDLLKIEGKLPILSKAYLFRFEKHINGMVQKYGKKEYNNKFNRGLEHIAKQLEARGVNMHMKPVESISPIEFSEEEMRGHE